MMPCTNMLNEDYNINIGYPKQTQVYDTKYILYK